MSFCVSIFHPWWVQCQVCGYQRGVWSTNLRHDGQTLHSSRQALIATLEEMSERAIARNPNKEVVSHFPGRRWWKHVKALLSSTLRWKIVGRVISNSNLRLQCTGLLFVQSTHFSKTPCAVDMRLAVFHTQTLLHRIWDAGSEALT